MNFSKQRLEFRGLWKRVFAAVKEFSVVGVSIHVSSCVCFLDLVPFTMVVLSCMTYSHHDKFKRLYLIALEVYELS